MEKVCMSKISPKGLVTIEKYLNICGKPTPYYLHSFKRINLFPNRVYIGKGSPEEIIDALQSQNSSEQIGIDCSGFVCHIIHSTVPITSVIKHPSPNLITKIRFFLRPIEKISVKVLIHPVNAIVINDISQIQPWDLIHTWDLKDNRKRHVLIVFEVDDNIIHYAHASQTENKVVKGKFEITDPSGSLEDQKWPNSFFLSRSQITSGIGLVRLLRIPQKTVCKR